MRRIGLLFFAIVIMLSMAVLSACGCSNEEEGGTQGSPNTGTTDSSGTGTTDSSGTGTTDSSGDGTTGSTNIGGTTDSSIVDPSHVHNYTTSVVAPTCTEKGYTLYACQCGESFTADEVEMIAHAGGDWITDVWPTCTSQGEKHLECMVCKTKLATEKIDKLAHVTVVHESKAPTCYEIGWDEYTTCLICGESTFEEKAKLEHYSVSEATCTSAKACDMCGFEMEKALGHQVVTTQGVEATCSSEGKTEGKSCQRCFAVLQESVVIAKLGHSYEVTKGYAADCENTGLTDGMACSSCGDISVEQSIISLRKHTYTDSQDVDCNVCGNLRDVDASCSHTGNIKVLEAVDATCYSYGFTRGEMCLDCGEVLVEQESLSILNHTEKVIMGYDATCTEHGLTNGVVCDVCDTVIIAQALIEPLGHIEAVALAVAPTCDNTGLTAGVYCDDCGYVIVAQRVIAPMGHYVSSELSSDGQYHWNSCERQGCEYEANKSVHINSRAQCGQSVECEACGTECILNSSHELSGWLTVKAATCTEEGESRRSCVNCDYYETTAIELKAHTYKEWTIVYEANCSTAGLEERKCECGAAEQREIKDKGHKTTVVTVEASCTEDGYTIVACEECDTSYITDYKYATGHKYGEEQITVKSTCEVEGVSVKTCEYCGKEQSTTIEALKHNYVLESVVKLESGNSQVYKCTNCAHTYNKTDDNSGTQDQPKEENIFLDQCKEDFSFVVKSDKSEKDLLDSIKIYDAYFENSEHESREEVTIDFSLEKLDKNKWKVVPSEAFEPGTSYNIELESGVEFADYNAKTLTIKIKIPEEFEDVIVYKDSIKFLKALEAQYGGYYPYELAYSADSDCIYLYTGNVAGLFEGDILCIGDYASVDELYVDKLVDCTMGKIEAMSLLNTGKYIIVLSQPELDEIFEQLDVNAEMDVNFDELNISEEEVTEQISAALYENDSFIEFLSVVNLTAQNYLTEKDLDTSVLSEKMFLKSIDIDPSLKINGTELTMGIDGVISVPIKTKNGTKLGSLDVKFSIVAKVGITLNAELELKKVWFIPVGLKYFDVSATQYDSLKFDFEISINIAYELKEQEEEKKQVEEPKKFVCNTNSGIMHEKNCLRVTYIKDKSKLKYLNVTEMLDMIESNPTFYRECMICKPVEGLNRNALIINSESKVFHAYNCFYVSQMSEENIKKTSFSSDYLILKGYTACDHCRPDEKEEDRFTELMSEATKEKNLDSVFDNLKNATGGDSSSSNVRKGINLGSVGFTYAIFTGKVDVNFVLNFDLKASLEYHYAFEHSATYGFRIDDNGVTPYQHDRKEVTKNELLMAGKATLKAGFEFDFKLGIVIIEKWASVGIAVEVGGYIQVGGVYYNDFTNGNDEEYAAAYAQAGIYLDVTFHYSLLKWNGRVPIYDQEYPLITLGYDRVYYSYAGYVDELVVKNEYNIDSSDLLRVVYYDLKTMKKGYDKLKTSGVEGQYIINITMADGTHCFVENGVIKYKEGAPCIFYDQLVIEVINKSEFYKALGRNSLYSYIDKYVINVEFHVDDGHKYTVADPQDKYIAVESTCYSLAKYRYLCEYCGKAGDVYYEYGDYKPHTYADEFTCHDRECLVCGYLCVATTPHPFTDWIEVEVSQCSPVEYSMRMCRDCIFVEYDERMTLNPHPHEFEPVAVNPTCYEGGYVDVKCKNCGIVQLHVDVNKRQHNLKQLHDSQYHYDICVYDDCDYEGEKIVHRSSKKATCTTDEVCNGCGYVMTVALEHVWSQEYKSDGLYHWNVCTRSGCNATTERQAHFGGEATCVKKKSCGVCGASYGSFKKHVYDQEVIDEKYLETAATCQAPAQYHFSCVCGATGTRTFEYGEVTPHPYVEKVVEPTCYAGGYTEYICKCGDTYKDSFTDIVPHKESELTQYEAPTCTESGKKGTHCIFCEKPMSEEEISPLGHKDGEPQITEPTCTEDGKEVINCTVCGAETGNKILNAKGHQYSIWQEKIEAECEKDGVLGHYSCIVCGKYFDADKQEIIEIRIPALVHDYKSVTIIAPDCENGGKAEKTCLICGNSITDELDPLGHNWNTEYTKNENEHWYDCLNNCGKKTDLGTHQWSEQTCENGITCLDCGYVAKEAEGHKLGAWVTQKEPTCEQEGVVGHYHCTVCEKNLEFDKKTEIEGSVVIPKLEHKYDDGVETVAPGCDTEGEKIFTCLFCKHEKKEMLDPIGHKWKTSSPKSYDSEYHWIDCSNGCGQKKDVTRHIPGDETCLGGIKCTECKYQIKEAQGHDDGEWRVTKEPTCTKGGERTRYCTVCNEELEKMETNPVGHYKGEWTDEIPATCIKEGVKGHFYCSVCKNYLDIEENIITDLTIGFSEHIFGEWQTINEPTCEEDGKEVAVCTVCKEEKSNIIPKLGHKWQEKLESSDGSYHWRACLNGCGSAKDKSAHVESAETCLGGIKCVVCEYVIQEPTGHKLSQWFIEVPPTCTADGTKAHYYCYSCEKSFDESIEVIESIMIPKINHSFKFVERTKEPTCDQAGIDLYACENCQQTEDRSVDPLEHKWSQQYQMDSEYHWYNCERDGCVATKDRQKHKESEETCLGGIICDDCKYQCKAPIGYHQESDWIIEKEPTCTNDGTMYKECLKCAEKIDEDVIKTPGHSFTDWVVTNATCQAEGSKARHCINCGKRESATIPRLPHEAGRTEKNPDSTCVKEGKLDTYCANCGEVMASETIAKKPHDWGNWEVITEVSCTSEGHLSRSCNNCGAIDNMILPILEHEYGEFIEEKAPTCAEEGRLEHYQCSSCKKYFDKFKVEIESIIIPKLDHSEDEGTITTPPKCEVDGEKTYVCIECGNERIEPVSKIGHKWSETVTITADKHWYECENPGCESTNKSGEHSGATPSCEQVGICTECKHPYLMPTGHSYSDKISHSKYTHFYKCVNEGCDQRKDETKHTIQQTYDVGKEDKGTIIVISINVYDYCAVCGYKELIGTDSIDEHDDIRLQQRKDPTCTEGGLDWGLSCGVCGHVYYEQKVISALGHNFVNGVCTRCKEYDASQGLEFVLNEAKTGYMLVGLGTCTDEMVVIPSMYNGLPVVSIGDASGSFNVTSAAVTSIRIPDSITTMGFGALSQCQNLTDVYYTGTLEQWLSIAFVGDADASQIPYGYDRLYMDERLLTDLVLPNKTVAITAPYFTGYRGLKSVVMPSSLTTVGPMAFAGCTGLETVVLGEKTLYIGEDAFFGCDSLTYCEYGGGKYLGTAKNPYMVLCDVKSYATEITVSNYTRAIMCSFEYYSALDTVHYEGSIDSWSAIIFRDERSTPMYQAEHFYVDGTLVTEITLSSSVKVVNPYAFYGFDDVTSVTLESVQRIGAFAFAYCGSLENLTLPSSLTKVDEGAFGKCAINSVTYGGSIDQWNAIVFEDDAIEQDKEGETTLPEDSEDIGVVIPSDGRLDIDDIFGDVDVNVDDLFGDNSSNKLYSNPISYGPDFTVGQSADVTYIYSKNEPTASGKYYYFENRRVYTWEEHTSSRGLEYLLSGDKSYYVLLGIGSCNDTVISIPSTYKNLPVRVIAGEAFIGCTDIVGIELPSTITLAHASAFRGCTSLKTISVASGNASYKVSNSLLLSADGKVLVKSFIPDTVSAFMVPNTVTSICDYAFEGANKLTSIFIPKTVEAIGTGAFNRCDSIKIYCEATSQPSSWDASWNCDQREVVWGHTHRYTSNVCVCGMHSGEINIATNATITSDVSSWVINTEYLIDGDRSTGTSLGYSAARTTLTFQFGGNKQINRIVIVTNGKGTYPVTGNSFTEVSKNNYNFIVQLLDAEGNEVFTAEANSINDANENCEVILSLPNPAYATTMKIIGIVNYGMLNGMWEVEVYGGGEHNFVSAVTKPATHLETGIRTYTCVDCGASYEAVIPKISEHTFVDGMCACGLSQYIETWDVSYTSDDKVTAYLSNGSTAGSYVLSILGTGKMMGTYSMPWSSYNLERVIVGEGVTSIGAYAFRYNHVGTLEISSTVTNIVLSALQGNRIDYIVVDENNSMFKSIDGNLYSRSGEVIIRYAFGKEDTTFTVPSGVTEIGDYAFFQAAKLTSVSLPDSVTKIGRYAFQNCKALESIKLSQGLKSIATYAFYGCEGLTSIEIPKNVTSIANDSFRNCSNLVAINIANDNETYKSVDGNVYTKDGTTFVLYAPGKTDTSYTISNGTLAIGAYAFYGNAALENVLIPEGVTSIGSSAFQNCKALTSITLPNSVTTISSYAFQKCSALANVAIPGNVTTIGSYAFNGCESITSVVIPSTTTTIGSYAFGGCTGLASVVLPDSLKSIGSGAFQNCTALTEITIPETVETIGNSAFYNCTGITSIVIPKNVRSIGGSAFYGCKSLVSITVDEDNGYYKSINGTLYSKDGKTLIVHPAANEAEILIVPQGVTSIQQYAFKDCSKLKEIELPQTVKTIGSSAFQNCQALTSINIPDSVTEIGSSAFENCTSLASVTVPNGVTAIKSYTFRGCTSLVSVALPSGLTSIGSSAFQNCQALTSIAIPNGVTSIGSYAFYNCRALTSISIPDSVTEISSSAFENCTSLASVSMPNGIIAIRNYAFRGCTSLESIALPSGLTSIGSYAFYNCRALTSISIPDSVTEISSGAFENCTSLASVSMPNGIIAIRNYAFRGCTSLESIALPSGLTSIGSYAFYNCRALASINIPNSVTEIGDYAFVSCISLTSIVIPDSVTSMGVRVFGNCSELTIKCVADAQPSGWNKNWNNDSIPVVWGYLIVADEDEDSRVSTGDIIVDVGNLL